MDESSRLRAVLLFLCVYVTMMKFEAFIFMGRRALVDEMCSI